MKIVSFILFLLFANHVFGQVAAAINRDSCLIDFQILRAAIKEYHPLLSTTEEIHSFDRTADSLADEIPKLNSLNRFYFLTGSLCTSVGCGHTYIYPVKNKVFKKNEFPFSIKIDKNEVYIKTAFKKQSEGYTGDRIISINGIPVLQIMEQALTIISSDGNKPDLKYSFFRKKFSYYVNLVLGNPSRLDFITDRQTFTLTLPTQFSREDEDEDYEESITFHQLAVPSQTVLLKIYDFDEGEDVIHKCFQYISEKKIENLVIDLRNNPGGNGNIGSTLLEYILDSSFTCFLDQKGDPLTSRYIKADQGLVSSDQFIEELPMYRSYYFTQEPISKNHFHGKVFVLTNYKTCSTAAYVASYLKHKSNAVFIGGETGSYEYAIGGGMIGKIILPYSRFEIKFPLFRWRFNAIETDGKTGIKPHFYLNDTADDQIIFNKITELTSNNNK